MPDPKAVIIIPSRYASQRLPRKPLVPIAGKMLVERVHGCCKLAKSVDRVVVATDHEEIAEAVRQFGGEVVMTSPDCASGTDRIEEAARILGLTNEIIINVQGDEPLMTGAVIDAVIAVLREKPDVMVATAVSRLKKTEELHSPNVVKAVLSASGQALYFSRAAIPYHRDLGSTGSNDWMTAAQYYKHIGIYGYRMPALKRFVELPEGTLEKIERLEQLRFMEAGIAIQTTLVEYDSVAVDTSEDVRAVELILAERSLG